MTEQGEIDGQMAMIVMFYKDGVEIQLQPDTAYLVAQTEVRYEGDPATFMQTLTFIHHLR